jgi:hypothetical protein
VLVRGLGPGAVHSTSRSGGLSDITNQRAVSAPKRSMMLTGSTTFFLDFDILAEGMTSTASPVAFSFPVLDILGQVIDRAAAASRVM